MDDRYRNSQLSEHWLDCSIKPFTSYLLRLTHQYISEVSYISREHSLYNYYCFSGVGVIALNKELGCLAPNIASDSRPMKLVQTVNKLVEALQEAERNFHWWKFFKTKSYSDLEIAHADFLE